MDFKKIFKKHVKKHIDTGRDLTKRTAISSKFDTKKHYNRRRINNILFDFLEKAGYDMTPETFSRRIFKVDMILIGFLSLIVILMAIVNTVPVSTVLVMLLLIWTLVFFGLYLVSMLVMFVYLDFKIFERTKQIENVLPDFLQLTSANISAGMPIDRALWFAVRPRFGVLASEMEEIAKSTFTGDDLTDSLLQFTKKYDSRVLKESVNLIIAGIDSGGELAELLSKIADNIRQTKLMKKEISAAVMTYVIFIGAASIIAAPVLFALSTQLLRVITSIASSFDTGGTTSTVGAFSLNFSSEAIAMGDFVAFSVVVIAVTSFFSSAIIGVIRKGTVKGELKNFPIFVAIALVVYYFASLLLKLLLGNFI